MHIFDRNKLLELYTRTKKPGFHISKRYYPGSRLYYFKMKQYQENPQSITAGS
jgi:hypothetical protein